MRQFDPTNPESLEVPDPYSLPDEAFENVLVMVEKATDGLIHRYPNTNMIEVVSRKNRHGHEFDFYLDWDINRGIVTPIYENLPDMKNDS